MAAQGLEFWLKKLTRQNMPVVGQIISELNDLTGNDDAEINQLAEVILRDPHMTSHVLRIANSVHYNYSSFPINTVSRAVVLIGLKGMRAICISLLLIETLLKQAPKEQLLKLIAQALHAATQARDLIKVHQGDSNEEVFIAALLFHLGEMAFLANEPMTDANQDLFRGDALERRDAMERVLGTSFKAITRGLARHWRLGGTLERALYPKHDEDQRVRAVILGERMSRAALKGWESGAANKVVAEISQFTGWDIEASRSFVIHSAERATEVALQFGAPQVCPLIPNKHAASEDSAARGKRSKIMRPNSQLQLNILRELSNAAYEKIEVNTLFQMVVEGMHRGTGLERVALVFNMNNRAKARYMLGEGTEDWRVRFDFDTGPRVDNMFTRAIEAGGTTWVDTAYLRTHAHLVSDEIADVIGRQPALIHIVTIGKKPAAFFYADRSDYGGTISRDQFESFRHFGSQAQISLNALSQVVNVEKRAVTSGARSGANFQG